MRAFMGGHHTTPRFGDEGPPGGGGLLFVGGKLPATFFFAEMSQWDIWSSFRGAQRERRVKPPKWGSKGPVVHRGFGANGAIS